MIYSLNGKLLHIEEGFFVVECAGVGYLCKASATTLSCLPPKGSEVFVYTTMTYNQETGSDLYGFYDRAEQDCFKMLTSISGIGPKAALAVLSEFTPDSFALAVASGDAKAITRAKGIGPKAAQRIILELRDKISNDSVSKGFASAPSVSVGKIGGNAGEAIAAMVSLGYTNSEAAAVIGKLDQSLPVDEMIKAALKAIAMKR